jgi:subtilisin family serine protease
VPEAEGVGEPSYRRLLCAFLFAGFGALSLSGVVIEPDDRKIDPALRLRDLPAATAAPVFIRVAGEDAVLAQEVRNLGGTARRIHPRIYAARIPRDAARYLSNRPQVVYIEAERIARTLLDESRPAVSADDVHLGSPAWPAPFNGGIFGADVFVGIVDTGLSGGHPDFAGRVDHTFSFSTADPLQDTNGHGTHVTGIAAGDGAASAGQFTGMAPASRLLIARAGNNSFLLSNIFSAIDSLLDFAESQGGPVAINLSLGLVVGPHDGTSAFETFVNDRATGPAGSRRIIAVAAGNERNLNEHFQADVPPFGVASVDVTLENVSRSPSQGDTLQFWADGDDSYDVAADLGTDNIAVPPGKSGTSPGGRITVSNGVAEHPNGATLISLFFSSGSGTANIQLTRTRNGGTGRVDGYIDFFDGAFEPGEEFGSITEPANADNVITVGSFNTKPGGGAGLVGGISSFSSLGPTRDGRIKPDVAAPGSLIYSARSQEAVFEPIQIVDDNYVIMRGTSMAAPHVAGIAALVWESNPNLTGAQMRERLRRTAEPVLVDGASPNTAWGFGKVDAFRAVSESVASIGGPSATTPGTPVVLSAENSSAAFGSTLTSYQWFAAGGATVIPSPDGTTAQVSAPTPGDYTVALTVGQAAPAGTASSTDNTVLRVNNIPVARISGPAASESVGALATFSGAGSSDEDGQALTHRWILVSRPDRSSATLPTTDSEVVTLFPDLVGTYEIGLRVDDGLDNSALTTVSFAAGAVRVGGGGGCSLTGGGRDADLPSAAAALLLALLPVAALDVRRRIALRARRGA